MIGAFGDDEWSTIIYFDEEFSTSKWEVGFILKYNFSQGLRKNKEEFTITGNSAESLNNFEILKKVEDRV